MRSSDREERRIENRQAGEIGDGGRDRASGKAGGALRVESGAGGSVQAVWSIVGDDEDGEEEDVDDGIA